MGVIFQIAKNTFKENIRDRILYGLVVFAVLLFGFSLVLGGLSFAEQARISINFGLTGIHIGVVILSIFVGSSLVSKEMEKRTIFTLLPRPLTRLQFIIGKLLGLIFVMVVIVIGLSIILSAVLWVVKWDTGRSYYVALYGVLLEALVLLSLTTLFCMFTRPSLAVLFSLSLFLIGHWIDSLDFFVAQSQSKAFKLVAEISRLIIPDLEKMNWKAAVLYNDYIPTKIIASVTFYSFSWCVFLIAFSGLLFRRKDFA